MANNKTNKEKIMALAKEINKKEGEGTLYSLGSEHANLTIPRWSTGIEDLDAIIGGGMPEGRVVQIVGAEGSGKTTLLYHLLSMHELALDIPIEGCVDKDTEFFNGKEWKNISDYEPGEVVLQYNEDGTASLEKPKDYVVYDSKVLNHVQANRFDMVISDYHNVVYETVGHNKLTIKPFKYIKDKIINNKNGFNGNLIKTFSVNNKGIELTDDEIRLMVAVFADGNFPNNTTWCSFGVKKTRKIERLKNLLDSLNIEYKTRDQKGTTIFTFYAIFNSKHFPEEWYNMTEEQFEIVIDEMQHWDGCQFQEGHMPSFSTIYKRDADFIQYAYTVLGYPAYITTRDRRDEIRYIGERMITTDKVSYNVCSGKVSKIANMRVSKLSEYKTLDNKMYCFTMDSGMWIMRRNDKIIVTGNTFDAERAGIFGNRPKQLLVYRARYGEDAMNRVIQFAKSGIPMIGIDSIPSLIPKDDFEKIITSADKNSIEQQSIGGIARLLNRYLPVIEDIIEHTGTTLIMTNQLRDKMNAMMFGPKTDYSGGKKLRHSLSLNLEVARRAWIDVPNKNPANSAKNERVGMIMKVRVQKSKVNNPMGECELPLFFDRGFVSHDDVKTIRQEIMAANNEKYNRR